MIDFFFTLSGWLFAIFTTILWFIICAYISATWHKQLIEMLKSFDELLSAIRKDCMNISNTQSDDTKEEEYHCSSCGADIVKFDNFCYACGQALDWDGYEDSE